ncbi:MAG: hypothetical protein RLZZ584_1435 [Pseudomonadota bacterium]|jgi:predicted deacylase
MRQIDHPLRSTAPGSQLHLVSLHYGQPGAGPKAHIQAALHADEVPAMLVAHHLRARLGELEAAGRLRGEIVLVPAANPIGMQQWLLRGYQGRFELGSGENFNRNYADLTEAVAAALAGRLGDDEAANVALVRAALREAAAALPAASTLDDLRKTLFTLAVDADIVLDLHCDGEAVLHFYTTPGCWPAAELLARCLGARAVLLADRSGGDPFDEACSMVWPQLAARLGRPLPQACLAATVELRGEADVTHELAARDAAGIVDFLTRRGLIAPAPGEAGAPQPETLPELLCEPTPLAGSMPLVAPHGGVLTFLRHPGDQVVAGEHLADLIDPISGLTTIIASPADGLFFAHENRRYAIAGMPLGKVAGQVARRSGKLLSA